MRRLPGLTVKGGLDRGEGAKETRHPLQRHRLGPHLCIHGTLSESPVDDRGTVSGGAQVIGQCLAFQGEDLTQKAQEACRFHSQLIESRAHREAKDRGVDLRRRSERLRRQG